MDFAAINYPSVVLATLAAYIVGAVYYTVLGKVWVKAAKLDPATVKRSTASYIISFIAELVLALILFLVLNDITFAGSFSDDFDYKSGIAWALIFWAGLVAMPLVVNHRYQGFGWALTIIDAVHWLLVLLVMGAVLGWFGVAETSLLNGALTI
ncbi:DUF1761 domain-containing protein [Rhizobium sp.]